MRDYENHKIAFGFKLHAVKNAVISQIGQNHTLGRITFIFICGTVTDDADESINSSLWDPPTPLKKSN